MMKVLYQFDKKLFFYFHKQLVAHINKLPNKLYSKRTRKLHFKNLNKLYGKKLKKITGMTVPSGCFVGSLNTIYIHRTNKYRPRVSYGDEICTILHEWGHLENMEYNLKNNKDNKYNNTLKSITSFDYETPFNKQLFSWYKEELLAWIRTPYLLFTVCSYRYLLLKIFITFLLFFAAIESMFYYSSIISKIYIKNINTKIKELNEGE